jgi:hypothetical protein
VVQVGVLLDGEPEELGEWLTDAAAFDAAGADALWIDPGPVHDVLALTAALAAVTFRSRLVVTLPDPGAPERMLDTIRRLSRDRLTPEPDGNWEHVPMPEGRAAWRALCADAAERGVTGLVVPANPRLLDLLRNPDDPGERHDLHLAQG